jgi:hypothetical protein
MTQYRNILILIIALIIAIAGYPFVSLAETTTVDAELLVSQVREDTEWFGGYPSRTVGQPGHDDAFNELYRRVKAIAGKNVWRHEVPFVVPQVLEANLTIKAGPKADGHRIYPLWPSGPRLNTTPVEGIEGRLIYVGRSTIEEFPAESLKHIEVFGNAELFMPGKDWETI